jgi:hypothetical protein
MACGTSCHVAEGTRIGRLQSGGPLSVREDRKGNSIVIGFVVGMGAGSSSKSDGWKGFGTESPPVARQWRGSEFALA